MRLDNGLDVNQTALSELARAALSYWLNSDVASEGVFSNNSFNILTGQHSVSSAYILLSDGASALLIPPWKFFCCVSCDKVTYSPFSSFLNSKDFKLSWWCNSSPLDKK